MTPRTFFTIFIKILGVYLVVQSFSVIPQGLLTLFTFSGLNDASTGVIAVVFYFLLIIGIYCLILRYFVFKTEWVIDKLQLDQGFTEEKFELNIHRSTVLNIAIIVTGGLIFVDALPAFCQYAYTYFEQTQFSGTDSKPSFLILYFIKILFGYYLLTNSRFILVFIERQRKK